jgi:hypothetical protein
MVKEKHVYYNLLTGCQLLFKFSSQSSLFQMKTILPPPFCHIWSIVKKNWNVTHPGQNIN